MALTLRQNNETEITAFLRDARRLISIFALPISQSVPHIYLSMLPLTEKESKVSAHYLQRTSSLVCVKRRGVKIQSPLLKLLKGHMGRVTSVGYSPDGSLIVSGSWDKTVRIWDTESGEPAAAPFKADVGQIGSATFSPDGMHIIVGGESGIAVLDVESGRTIVGPFGDAGVLFVAVSPDGKHVISTSSEEYDFSIPNLGASALSKTVKMWDLKSGTIVGKPFVGHTDMILCAAYSRDGRFIVTGSRDKSVRVWNVESRRPDHGLFLGHTGIINSIDFSPDGKYVVSGANDGTVRVWEVGKGEVDYSPLTGHNNDVMTVAYSSDGARIVSCSITDTVFIWNSAIGQLVSGPFNDGGVGYRSDIEDARVAISPDGTRVVVASSNDIDNSLRIFDGESGKIENGPKRVRFNITRSIKFSTDGSCVISDDGTTWHVEDGEEVSKTEIEWQTLKVTSGMQIEAEGEIRWDPSIGFTTLSGYIIAVSPNGRRFAFSYYNSGSIRIWDKERDVLVCGPYDGQGGRIWSLTFSPDGRHIASGSDNLRVWDAETGRLLLGPFPELTGMQVFIVAYLPDGRHIALGSFDNPVRVLELETGRWEIFEGHSAFVRSVSFSPDGSRMVSSCWNDEVRIWNTRALAKMDQDRLLTSNSLNLSTWNLDSDGWVRGVHDELLLWVPPDLRPTLITPLKLAILNVEFSTELDFSYSAHGEYWHECFDPQALA